MLRIEINGMVYGRCLKQYLVPRKYSNNIRYYYCISSIIIYHKFLKDRGQIFYVEAPHSSLSLPKDSEHKERAEYILCDLIQYVQ